MVIQGGMELQKHLVQKFPDVGISLDIKFQNNFEGAVLGLPVFCSYKLKYDVPSTITSSS